MTDWTGNKNSVFKTLGASNHTHKEREPNEFYATDPVAIDKLAAVYHIPHRVWATILPPPDFLAKKRKI